MTSQDILNYGVGLAAPLVSLRLLSGFVASIKSIITPNSNGSSSSKTSNGDLVLALQTSQDLRAVVTDLERMRNTQLQDSVASKEIWADIKEFMQANTIALNSIVAASDRNYRALSDQIMKQLPLSLPRS